MIHHLPRNIIKKLQALALYQIAGGVVGLIVTIGTLLQFTVFTPLLIVFFAVAAGLYVFSLLCGWLLWNQYSAGIQLSIIHQYLQIVQFAIGGWAYTYLSGGYLLLGIDLSFSYQLLFDFGVLSKWQLTTFAPTSTVQLSFNFVAILMLVFLVHVKRDLEEETVLENFLKEENTN